MRQKFFNALLGVVVFGVSILATVPHQACFAQDVTVGELGEGRPWATPFYISDSGKEGPTVMITGGIHGNEPAGAQSADQIRRWPIVAGKLIVVPRVNTAGLEAKTRYIPGAIRECKDLNRNFPSPNIADGPRGEIAIEVWRFVIAQDPDWLFDLHEGYDFNISHRPGKGRAKSVGSSIIFDQNQDVGPLVERMLTAVNGTVTDEDRKFVLLRRGPKKTSLSSATIDVMQKRAMILETTFKGQSLSLRTSQHRAMMAVALRQLGMINQTQLQLDRLAVDQRATKNEMSAAP